MTLRLALAPLAVLLFAACVETPIPAAPPDTSPRVGDPDDRCGGHALPESMCTICNPELTAGFVEAGDWCIEHGLPESACPKCNPMTPPGEGGSFAPGTRIRFRSPETEARAGIETVPAGLTGLGVGVEATARIAFDADRVAEIRTPTGGVVRELRVDLGDAVSPGSVLVVLESAEVGDLRARLTAARERLHTAEADLERQRELRAAGVASARQEELALQEVGGADSAVRAAVAALGAAGAGRSGASGRYSVTSPIAGSVVRRPVALGSAVTDRDLLALVADTSTVWALLDIQEEDVAGVRPGQEVTLAIDGIGDRSFEGTITWLSAEVDPRTRTVTARAELANPDGLLRANQFGRASVEVQASADVVSVPRSAVQRLDDGAVVFVRAGPGLYEPRAVDVGLGDAWRVQLLGPVDAGDEVVTTGAFLLKTELRKDAIGAGCCEVEAPGE